MIGSRVRSGLETRSVGPRKHLISIFPELRPEPIMYFRVDFLDPSKISRPNRELNKTVHTKSQIN